ncbi:hypothetical protein C7458_11933 [Williamsia muralis]|nr:hypothetical protein C7458_11933 [Williamsia marianensis]
MPVSTERARAWQQRTKDEPSGPTINQSLRCGARGETSAVMPSCVDVVGFRRSKPARFWGKERQGEGEAFDPADPPLLLGLWFGG